LRARATRKQHATQHVAQAKAREQNKVLESALAEKERELAKVGRAAEEAVGRADALMVAGMEEIQRRWSRGRMFSAVAKGENSRRHARKQNKFYLPTCTVHVLFCVTFGGRHFPRLFPASL
jgi:hypothetical protein